MPTKPLSFRIPVNEGDEQKKLDDAFYKEYERTKDGRRTELKTWAYTGYLISLLGLDRPLLRMAKEPEFLVMSDDEKKAAISKLISSELNLSSIEENKPKPEDKKPVITMPESDKKDSTKKTKIRPGAIIQSA